MVEEQMSDQYRRTSQHWRTFLNMSKNKAKQNKTKQNNYKKLLKCFLSFSECILLKPNTITFQIR